MLLDIVLGIIFFILLAICVIAFIQALKDLKDLIYLIRYRYYEKNLADKKMYLKWMILRHGKIIRSYPDALLLVEKKPCEKRADAQIVYDTSQYATNKVIGVHLTFPVSVVGCESSLSVIPHQTVYAFKDGTLAWRTEKGD